MIETLKLGDPVKLSLAAKHHWYSINYKPPFKQGLVIGLRPGLIKVMNARGKCIWFSAGFWQPRKDEA